MVNLALVQLTRLSWIWNIQSQQVESWKWIWKLNIIPLVTLVGFMVCHGRLSTKVLLMRRKILHEDSYPVCKVAPKTLIHILWDIPLCNLSSLALVCHLCPNTF